MNNNQGNHAEPSSPHDSVGSGGISHLNLQPGKCVRLWRLTNSVELSPFFTGEPDADEPQSEAGSEPGVVVGAVGAVCGNVLIDGECEHECLPNECEKCGWKSFKYSTVHDDVSDIVYFHSVRLCTVFATLKSQ